jgi:hypothetical protein
MCDRSPAQYSLSQLNTELITVMTGHGGQLDDTLDKEKVRALEKLVRFWQEKILGEKEMDHDGSWQLTYRLAKYGSN